MVSVRVLSSGEISNTPLLCEVRDSASNQGKFLVLIDSPKGVGTIPVCLRHNDLLIHIFSPRFNKDKSS